MVKIGKPFTPSTILGCEEMQAKEIAISCGGGMGGSFWKVYSKDDFDLNSKFINISTNEDKEVAINTNNIVQVRKVKICKISIRNDGNSNCGKIGEIKDYYYILNANDAVNLLDVYNDNNSNAEEIKFNY